MPGLARSEANSCANPVLIFMHRTGGFLTDVAELRFSVEDLTTTPPTVVVAEAAVVLTACPGGSRLGLGRYVAPFTAGVGWNLGTHEVVWRYRAPAMADPQRVVRRRFEILDPTIWPSGTQYLSYVDSLRAQQLGLALIATFTITELQRALEFAARQIELLTGRFFEPRYQQYALTSKGGRLAEIGTPVIAVDTVTVEAAGVTGTVVGTLVDNTLLRVFNRHLGGLLDPDDRDAPRIEFTRTAEPIIFPDQGQLRFAAGVQNVLINGAFGYTDPDGTPLGRTPEPLARIAVVLASRFSADPLIEDPTLTGGRIRSARTRDQSVTLMSPRDSGMPAGATGDPQIDAVLAQYHRPPHFGATGIAGE